MDRSPNSTHSAPLREPPLLTIRLSPPARVQTIAGPIDHVAWVGSATLGGRWANRAGPDNVSATFAARLSMSSRAARAVICSTGDVRS